MSTTKNAYRKRAVLIERPHPITIRLPEKVWELLAQSAEAADRPASYLVVGLIEDWLCRDGRMTDDERSVLAATTM